MTDRLQHLIVSLLYMYETDFWFIVFLLMSLSPFLIYRYSSNLHTTLLFIMSALKYPILQCHRLHNFVLRYSILYHSTPLTSLVRTTLLSTPRCTTSFTYTNSLHHTTLHDRCVRTYLTGSIPTHTMRMRTWEGQWRPTTIRRPGNGSYQGRYVYHKQTRT